MMPINHDHDRIERVLLDGGIHEIPPEIMARARRQLDGLRQRMEAKETMDNDKEYHSVTWSWRRMLAWATPVAALLLLAVLAGMIMTEVRGQKVYAAAVQRIRAAQTMLVSMVTRFEGTPEMKLDIAFRNDGIVRVDMANNIRCLVDSRQMRTVTVDPNTKVVMEGNIANMPTNTPGRDPAKEIERLRKLPERASETLGTKELNGRPVLGYRVVENDETNDVWIDSRTRELVQVDASHKAFPGVHTSMSNFRFDVMLPGDYFSTAVPAGYKRQEFNLDMANPGAEDYCELLRMLVLLSPDDTFPPSMNPMEINKMAQNFQKSMDEKKKNGEPLPAKIAQMQKADPMKAAQGSARGMLFIVGMKPENDFHYVGAGVKMGEAKTPIAWWKPTDAKNYKVIYGDLTVKEEPPSAVPTPTPATAGVQK